MSKNTSLDTNRDYHSYANMEQIQVKHLDLKLTVDFAHKTLSGSVGLSLLHHQVADNDELILDSRDLSISRITGPDGQLLSYRSGEQNEILGAPLFIKLSESYEFITIEYKTNPGAEGLQWMPAEATDGKQYPYLFSQSQPVNCRSWIPLQDSPKARVTFQAQIHTPVELRAVMSAINNPQRNRQGIYHFIMDKAIPTHLLAITVGDLHFQKISERSGVYTEKGMLNRSAREFEDVEQMMQTAEQLMGPYLWERFDMLVLPASFPFGGMENPCLTFLTPTLIAGDKSLVSTVAHELAHSWTGNLVSNATWRDLWINEGFTTYFTIRIVEKVFGEESALFNLVLEYQRISKAVEDTSEDKQALCIDLRDGDPDDAFSAFSYVKGSMFVQFLEHRIGRDDFDGFLRTYIDYFAFQPITTEIIRDYIVANLVNDYVGKVSEQEVDEWIYGSGIPDNYPLPVSAALNNVKEMIDQWLAGNLQLTVENTADWTTDHWLYFLGNVPDELAIEKIQRLDECFHFTNSQNSEIAFLWFGIALNGRYEVAFAALKQYLIRIGRGKFVRPLYEKMSKDDRYGELVKEIYAAARDGYHPSIIKQLDRMLA